MTEIIKSVVCPICGCLCDDIEVTVENNEIVKMKNGCALCEAKMVHGYKSEERILIPMIRKDGKLVPVSMDEAVIRQPKFSPTQSIHCCSAGAVQPAKHSESAFN